VWRVAVPIGLRGARGIARPIGRTRDRRSRLGRWGGEAVKGARPASGPANTSVTAQVKRRRLLAAGTRRDARPGKAGRGTWRDGGRGAKKEARIAPDFP